MQIAKSLDSCAISRLPENSNGWRLLQPAAPVERGWFLWERGFRVHGIRAKLAGNFEVFGAMELKEALQTGVQPDSAGQGRPTQVFRVGK